MNILELYDRYRKQHATEFRNRLEAVAKSVLKMTENVPEEQAIKIFQTSSDREWFDIFENKSHPEHKEGFLFAGFSDALTYQFPYDDTAKELDRFMEKYYPYIVCSRYYSLNLYQRTITFSFKFLVDYDEKNVATKGIKIENSISLFNNDVEEMLQEKFNEDNWDELEKYDDFFYEYGSVRVSIKLN